MKHILIVDADTPLCARLATRLREAGHQVTTHARQERAGYRFDCTHPDAQEAIDRLARDGACLDRIVFGLPATGMANEDEACITDAFDALDGMLVELQAACQALRRADHGQVWVLVAEDSMGYFIHGLPWHPILAQARIAAVRSLAKEVFPLDLRVNALLLQPTSSDLDPAELKHRKSLLKAFSIRFRPPEDEDVAQLFSGLLEMPQLPMTGLVMPCGFGFPEVNL